MKRQLRACPCRFQYPPTIYGYEVQRATRSKNWTWKPVGTAENIDEAATMADPHKHVLIRCCGCGSDVVREYPSIPSVTHPCVVSDGVAVICMDVENPADAEFIAEAGTVYNATGLGPREMATQLEGVKRLLDLPENCDYTRLAGAVSLTKTQLAALQKDAERWRKLRNAAAYLIVRGKHLVGDWIAGDRLDAAIDSMEATQ